MSLSQVVQVPFAPELYGQGYGTLLSSVTSSNTASNLGMVEDDVFALQLYPRLLGTTVGAATTTLQLSTGSSIIFSLKALSQISGMTLLGEAAGFTEYQDGNGNWYYGAVLNLQDGAVATALGSNPSVNCIGEILITDATGAEKRYQFVVVLYQASYTSDSSSVVAPTPGQVLCFITGSESIPSGVDSLAISGLGLAQVPALIQPIVLKADGTHANIDAYLRAGWTGDGFTVDFDSVIPDDTFLLAWFIASSSGSVGSVAVPAAVDTLAVPLSLTRTPTLIVPVLVKAGGTELNIRAFLRAGWTGAGFTVDLNAVTPDATYLL